MKKPSPQPATLVELRDLLDKCFSISELDTLCFDLGVDPENLSGSTKSERSRGLIAYVLRRNMLDQLVELCNKYRPNTTWPKWDTNEVIPRSEFPYDGFQPESNGRHLKIFLCHGRPDKPKVDILYNQLTVDEFDPWFDSRKLLPGQDWEYEIRQALKSSDVVIICSSMSSVSRTGYVQKEIRIALDIALEQPQGAIFVIPLKFEPCELPDQLSKYQWINYWESDAYHLLVKSLRARAASLGLRPGTKDTIFEEKASPPNSY